MTTDRKINCRHCHAGPAALYPHVRHLESGIKLQVVKCTLCGWEASRPEPVATVRPLKIAAPQRTGKLQPCTRVGCRGSYHPTRSKRQLCRACGTTQLNWESLQRRGRTKQPAPLLRQGAVWIVNPQRQPKEATCSAI